MASHGVVIGFYLELYLDALSGGPSACVGAVHAGVVTLLQHPAAA